MKRDYVLFLCGLLLVTLSARSQTQPGSWEFSLSTNIGSTSNSSEASFNGQTYKDEEDPQSYFGLDLRAGIFAAEGFSLEPEIYVMAVHKEKPMFNLGANAAYTFTIPESPVSPFVTVGYGIGNSTPIMQRLFNRASESLDIPVLRAGGGLKVFIFKQVALKVEYRYERYTAEGSESLGYYSFSYKTVQNFHNVLIGFSVFLPSSE